MNSDSGQSFFDLDDYDLNRLATTAPIRRPRDGKLDIGGRLRVAAILRNAGIPRVATPVRIAGSTNEVWRAGDYVTRVGFVADSQRLRREARIVELLPTGVPHAWVVAVGQESFGEWMVVRRVEGMPLSEAWPLLDVETRRASVHELATAIRCLHELRLTPDQAASIPFPEGEGRLALPHQLPVTRMLHLVERCQALPHVDSGLLHAVAELIERTGDCFPVHERTGLIHGDLHFENVLTINGVITAILDFEWARLAPPEVDIEVLARFCDEPQIHITGNHEVDPASYRDVLRWFYEAYPTVFDNPSFVDRIMLCALSFELPALLAWPPSGPAAKEPQYHPLNRIRTLLESGTHAQRLGWLPE